MLKKLRRHVLVHRVHLGQLQRNREHPQTIESHPRGAVGLLKKTAGRQRLRSVENADVIKNEKAAGEQVVAFYVFAVHPPREVEQQFLEPAPLAPLLSDPQALRRQLFRFAGAPISYQ